jgi:hypothetical protein
MTVKFEIRYCCDEVLCNGEEFLSWKLFGDLDLIVGFKDGL